LAYGRRTEKVMVLACIKVFSVVLKYICKELTKWVWKDCKYVSVFWCLEPISGKPPWNLVFFSMHVAGCKSSEGFRLVKLWAFMWEMLPLLSVV
jgi:hypothetical protein